MTDLINCSKLMDLIDDSDYEKLASLSPEMERHINSCKNCRYYYLVSIKLLEKAESAEKINLWNEFNPGPGEVAERISIPRNKISFGLAGALLSFILVAGVITGLWINRSSLFKTGNIFVSAGHNAGTASGFSAGTGSGISTSSDRVILEQPLPNQVTTANYYYEASDLDYYYDISTQL